MNALEVLLVLNNVKGLGPRKVKILFEHFKDLTEILDEKRRNEIANIPQIGAELADEIFFTKENFDVRKELEYCAKEGIRIIAPFDEEYPENLKEIHDPPVVIYTKGTILKEDKIALSIVGSRRASLYGLETAERMAYDLAFSGITIVSGLARGIDGAAHKGALKAKGRTIAVLGSGIDVIYPKENRKIFQEISENGVIISEYPLGMPPLAFNFPQRNRIISGLSMGVLVVEAHKRSGSLITASMALGEGREVYAVPGRIDSLTAQGTNKLIKEGAKLVDCAEDILIDLAPNLVCQVKESNNAASGGIERHIDEKGNAVLLTLSSRPIFPEEITESTGFAPREVHSILTHLELTKKAKRLSDGSFVVC